MKSDSRGFSLIELMISVTLGLMIIAGVASIFVSGSRSYRQDERVSRLQDELRYGMARIVSDLEMAGFWTQMLDPAGIVVHTSINAFGSDCGAAPAAGEYWATHDRLPLSTKNNVTASDANTTYPCIASSDAVADTDIISIKRVAGASTTDTKTNLIYLRTNGTAGALYKATSDGDLGPASISGTVTVWDYVPTVYFIRRTNEAGDSIPTLYRKHLTVSAGNPTFESEGVAEGIENLQFEFGVDSDVDGFADFFVNAPSATQLGQTVAVRVTMLGRSKESDGSYSNQKTYVLGSLSDALSVTASDRFYRKTASTVVLVRNPTALAGLSRR